MTEITIKYQVEGDNCDGCGMLIEVADNEYCSYCNTFLNETEFDYKKGRWITKRCKQCIEEFGL